MARYVTAFNHGRVYNLDLVEYLTVVHETNTTPNVWVIQHPSTNPLDGQWTTQADAERALRDIVDPINPGEQ